MARAVGEDASWVRWAVAQRSRLGERVCGDQYYTSVGADTALTAVVDGLGHGEEAARAARAVVACLPSLLHCSLEQVLEACHIAAAETRGAVMSVVRFDRKSSTLSWMGVGNVEGVVFRLGSRDGPLTARLPLEEGVIGYRIPSVPTANELRVHRGDVVVLMTDGVQPNLSSITFTGRMSDIANIILTKNASSRDDALVWVGCFLGDPL